MSDLAVLLERWTSKWDVALLEASILNLMKQRPRYGGELVEICQQQITAEIKVPTIYGMLSRLGKSQLITEVDSRAKEGITRGTSRKYYGLTTQGEEFFELLQQHIGRSLVVVTALAKTEEGDFQEEEL